MSNELQTQQNTQKTAHSIKLQSFEGPLDLLLFLIQQSEVNIYDIPIAEITEQYLAYLRLAAQIDLDNLTDFYSMAATLIYIKSKMLLPEEISMDEEFEDPRQELVDKLIEYHKFKKYAKVIEHHYSEDDFYFIKNKRQQSLPFVEEDLWNEIDVWDLLKTFSSLLSSISPEHVFNIYEEVSVKEKLALLNELFETRDEIAFSDLIVREGSPMDVICAFLAILEAVKYRKIAIFQNSLFGDISIRALPQSETDSMQEDYS
ncbi:MAG: segregation and condensation protein A [Spirochaetota bacterium]